jgi:hypothetical protein
MENATQQSVPPVTAHKKPWLAAVGSFFFPGLGQVYNGEGFVKGLMYLIGTLIGSLIFFIPGLAIWLYGIYNAHKVANKMKLGILPVKGTTTTHIVVFIILSLIIEVIYAVVLSIIMVAVLVFIFGSSSSTSNYSFGQ